jgi:hypothetical protein
VTLGYNFAGKVQQAATSGNVPLCYLFFALGQKLWNETLMRVNDPN